jgi:hypothetical protein
MGLATGVGIGIQFSRGGGQSWDTQLPNKSDLSFLIKDGSRSGLALVDSVAPGTGDVDILPAYLYKPLGTQYYYHADNGALDIGANDLTFGMWVKGEVAVSGVYAYLGGKAVYGVVNGLYEFYCANDDKITFAVRTSGGLFSIVSEVLITDQAWHFLFGYVNKTTSKIGFYIDNVQIGTEAAYTGTIAALANAYVFCIGIANAAGGGSFATTYPGKASFSDTFVIHRLLSEAERTAAFSRSYPTDCAALYPFMGGGSHSFDVSGNGRTLTGVGSPIALANTKFGANGSLWGLNIGYTKYSNGYEDLYQGLKHDGTELIPTLEGGLAGYKKSVEGIHLGNLTDHNLANSVLAMKGASWDRSDATIFIDEARATTTFYDSTNADTKKYWHVSELNNLYMQALCNTGYKGLNFVKVSDQSYKSRKILNGIFAYNSEVTGDDYAKVVATLCGDYVFTDTYENDYVYWKWTTDKICTVNGAKMLKWNNLTPDTFSLSLDNGVTYGISANSPFNGVVPKFCHIFNNGNIIIASANKIYLSTNNLTSFAEVVPTGIDGNPFVATADCYQPLHKINSFVIGGVEMLIWGAYSINVATANININVFYSIDSGATIKSCYKEGVTDPPNLQAQHIHAVTYNTYDNSFWMSTGDNNNPATGESNWIKGEYDWDNDTWAWSKIAGDLDGACNWKSLGFAFDAANVYVGDDNNKVPALRPGFWSIPYASITDTGTITRVFAAKYAAGHDALFKLPYIIGSGFSQALNPVIITSVSGITGMTGHRLYAYPTSYLGNVSCMDKNNAGWYIFPTYITGIGLELILDNPMLMLKQKE